MPAPDIDFESGSKVTNREDDALLIDGSMLIPGLVELLGLRDRPQGDFVILAGFALHQFRHVPQPAEQFTWHGWRFRVVNMEGSRIDKMLVSPVEEPEQLPTAAASSGIVCDFRR